MRFFSSRFLKATAISAAMQMAVIVPVWAETAQEQSCGFVDAMFEGRVEGIQALRDIMHLLSERKFETDLRPELMKMPKHFRSAQVLELANINGLVMDHLIVVNSVSEGNAYFRFTYELAGNDVTGVHFAFNMDFDDALDSWPIFQEPVPLSCS